MSKIIDLRFLDLSDEGGNSLSLEWEQDLTFDEPKHVFGEGAFGTVIRGYLKKNVNQKRIQNEDIVVAIKTMDQAEKKAKERGGNQKKVLENIVAEFEREVWLMSGLNHKNVVKLYGVCFEPKPALVMEVVGGGALSRQLNDPYKMKEIPKFWAKVQVVSGEYAISCGDPPPFEEHFRDDMKRIYAILQHWSVGKSKLNFFSPCPSAADLVTAMKTFYEQTTREAANVAEQVIDDVWNDYKAHLAQVDVHDWPLRLKLAIDIAQGMAHLHSIQPPVVHRDLKTPNVFLTKPLPEFDGDYGSPLAKVGDFGLSARMFGLTTMKVAKGGGSSLDRINPLWAAPEVLRGEPYTTSSDVYAMGIMMWELVAREEPYKEVMAKIEGPNNLPDVIYLEKVKKKILEGIRPVFPGDTPHAYQELAKRCWQPDASRRPPFSAIYTCLRDICCDLAPELYNVLPLQLQEVGQEANQRDVNIIQPITPLLPPQAVCGASESDSLEILCVCSAMEGRLIWAGFHTGWVGLYSIFQKQWVLCDESDKHSGFVNALSYTPMGGSQVWTGSSDGSLRVWCAQPKNLTQLLDEIYHQGLLEVRNGGLGWIFGWDKFWVRLDGNTLAWFPYKERGSDGRRFNLSMVEGLSMEDGALRVDCKSDTVYFRIPRTEGGDLTEWKNQVWV